jgi:hypothetical protein
VNSRKRKVQDILHSSDGGNKQKKQRITGPKSAKKMLKTTKKTATSRTSKIRRLDLSSSKQTTTKRMLRHGSKAIRNINTAVKSYTSSSKHAKGKKKTPAVTPAAKPRPTARAVASMRRNVVTTVRGPRRAAALARAGNIKTLGRSGSTIKIISDV